MRSEFCVQGLCFPICARMSSTSLVSDSVIDTNVTTQEVTISITMATLLVVLVLLHVIFYIILNKKITEWYKRLQKLLPKSKVKTPRVTIMKVKPLRSNLGVREDADPKGRRPKTADTSLDRVSRILDTPRKLGRSYSIPPSSVEHTTVTLCDLQSFSLEMETFYQRKPSNLNAESSETTYSNKQIEIQNPVVQNVKLQMEMDQTNTCNDIDSNSVFANGYRTEQSLSKNTEPGLQ